MAQMRGVADAAAWARWSIPQIAAQVADGGETVADKYAYATHIRADYIAATPPPAGENLGAVTDVHLALAIDAATAPMEGSE